MEVTLDRPVAIAVYPTVMTSTGVAFGSNIPGVRTAENKPQQSPAASAEATPSSVEEPVAATAEEAAPATTAERAGTEGAPSADEEAASAASAASTPSIDRKSPAASPSPYPPRRAAKAARSNSNGRDDDPVAEDGGNAGNLSALYQARADLKESLSWCEDRLGSMEEDLLRRSADASTPLQVNPRERIFSRSSRTSAFWRSPRSRRRKYRHGIDTPPFGYYARDRPTARNRSGSTDDEHTVIAYDAFRRKWVAVPKRQLEKAAMAKAAAVAASLRPRHPSFETPT